jgi:hypothetical protein
VYPVSQDFVDKLKANDIPPIHAKCIIDYTDPFMDQSIEINVNEQANVSYLQQTADSVDETLHKWASLDGSWLLDGTYHLAPSMNELSQYQFGWWANQLAGTDGIFIEPFPSLTVTHFPRPIHTLKAVGDMARQEYPVDFSISLYAEDDILLHTETVTNNTEIVWTKPLVNPVLDVVKQVLTITKWSHSGRQAKIIEFFTSIQEIYLSNDLMNLTLLEEREVSIGSLPVGNISANEISIILNNESKKFDVNNEQSPLKNLLKPNRRIRPWLGVEINDEIEWVPLGTFWSLDWDSPDDTVEAIVTARDRMELLRKGTFQSSQAQQNKSLYQLAEQVFQDAGLTADEYIIDTKLQNIIIPYTWFKPVSHREALRIIAEAALAVVYADRDGKICIEFFALTGTTTDLVITDNDYFPPLHAPSKHESVANEVIVTTLPLRPITTTEQVYKSNEPIVISANSTRTLTVYYNSPPVIDAIANLDNPLAGVNIIESNYYGWGAEIKIQNTNGTDQQVILTINGKPLIVQNKERAVARDEISITENGVLRYEFPENPLVQSLTQAQMIADSLLASVKDSRRDIEIDWKGNPALLLGDQITFKNKDYHVIRQEIEWSGALDARLTGRRSIRYGITNTKNRLG